MKKLVLIAIVAVALSTAAYAIVCADCKTCPMPCSMKSVAPMCGAADAPKCDPNSKPAPKCGGAAPACEPNKPAAKCGGDAPKCDPNSKPAPKCAGCTDPNKPKCDTK
jgi:hypothetical protein